MPDQVRHDGMHRHSGGPWIEAQGRARESSVIMALRYPLRITHHGFGLVLVTHHSLPVTASLEEKTRRMKV